MIHPSPHRGNMYGHFEERLAELKALYPSLFAGEMISCDWPDGWHLLVRSVCAFAHEHHPQVQWLQIKEKYASLRMHYQGGPLRMDLHTCDRLVSQNFDVGDFQSLPRLQAVIDEAEKRSRETCCLCGGSGVAIRKMSGWMMAVCEQCAPLIDEFNDLPPEERRR